MLLFTLASKVLLVAGMAHVPGGSFRPLYASAPVRVASFYMDAKPISLDGKNAWTNVTYKQAANYCAARGKRLPTTNEWEYAAKKRAMKPASHGRLWEWTSDFHHIHTAHCANGIVQTGDASDYEAFMRYSLRSTLNANSSMSSLGFRCVV